VNSINTPVNTETDLLNMAAKESATLIAQLSGIEQHDIAIVLGSGWVPAAEKLVIESPNLASPTFPISALPQSQVTPGESAA